MFASKRLGEMFGIGAVPIPMFPLPLPVRYRIYYGEPIAVGEEFTPTQADEPHVVQELAARVQAKVQRMIEKGLSERTGVFR